MHYRRRPQGHVSALAPYLTQSGKRRVLRCHTCETPFTETRATVFFDLRTAADNGMLALQMLLVRVDLAGISFVLGVTEEPVLVWRRRAAHQAAVINHPLRRALPVTPVQRDEMGNFIARKPAGETDAAGESWPGSEEGRHGVWGSLAPELRWRIAAMVGPRRRDTAKAVVAVTKARVAGIPAFFSDGCTGSLAAVSAACHVVTTVARPGKRGRPRTPRCAPHPALAYGQWVKQQKQGKLRTLSTRVVLGAERLPSLGLTSRTALVERRNLTVRQALAPLPRQPASFCTARERQRPRVVFCQACDNVARSHTRWRQPLPLPARTRPGAIRPRWQERTPAMAAGLTDHVWTLRALLTAKFEP
jgi:hypothetical protein